MSEPLDTRPAAREWAMRPSRPIVGRPLVIICVATYAFLAIQLVWRRLFYGDRVMITVSSVLISTLALFVGRALVRRFSVSGPRPPLRLDQDLSVWVNARKHVVIRVSEVLMCAPRWRGSLHVASRSARALLQPRDFVDRHAIAEIRAAVRGAVAAQADGASRLAEIDAHDELLSRPNRVTWMVAAGLVVIYLIEKLIGLGGAPELVRVGANARGLILDGEVWRVFSAGLLHVNNLHIVVNTLSLLSLGTWLERVIGAPRLLLFAGLASLSGNLASTVFADAFASAGASSALFGCMGTLLVIELRHRRTLPAILVASKRSWVVTLVLNAGISLIPGVDLWAHAGGFVAGAVLALTAPSPMIRTRSRQVTIAAAVVVGAHVSAVIYGFARGASVSVEVMTHEMMAAELRHPRDAARTNAVTWWLVVAGPRDGALLAAAEVAQRGALLERADVDETAARLDTLAWLQYLQADVEGAVATERAVAVYRPHAGIFSTLHRFLRRLPLPDANVRAQIKGQDLVLEAPPGTVAYFETVEGKAGLLRAVARASDTQRHLFPIPEGLPHGTALRLLFTAEGGPEIADESGPAWRPHEPWVDEIPE